MSEKEEQEIVVQFEGVTHRYGEILAADNVTLSIPAGKTVGFIGPDGVGKSTWLGLVAGARALQEGKLTVLDGDMSSARHRNAACVQIAYMPQGLGKNLYPTLSVFENIDFFGRLFGQGKAERNARIKDLLASTGMTDFADRPAQKLSGGMKQKLGLCCALIHDPDLLILDEPTTGVDPLARRQFWELIERIRERRPQMSVLVATAYMDEAQGFDWLVAVDEGKVLATGTPAELLERTGKNNLESAFLSLLPESKRQGHQELIIPPLPASDEIVIESHGLTKKFGDFVAVSDVNLQVKRGEIFGFLGSNGCGKSTTMKMLTGLLPPSEGTATLLDQPIDANDLATRRRVGYMSQNFSLYAELTVYQNLMLHAKLFYLPLAEREPRVAELAKRFELESVLNTLPNSLPLGIRQRLQLAVAVLHKPDVLILDEPTSGVDPVARDTFWQLMVDLSRNDGVTLFISTHFMNEAERCDRMSMMHAGIVLDTGTPAELVEKRGADSLEDAFIGYLEEAIGDEGVPTDTDFTPPAVQNQSKGVKHRWFSLQRLLSYSSREAVELRRDPIRLFMAMVGSVVLMLVMGYGINMDVENLTYAVLDYDQTIASQNYALEIEGSRYFEQQAPLRNSQDIDERMRAGTLSLAIEIPPGFGRDLDKDRQPEIGMWIDGAMPQRAETIKSYTQALHNATISNWILEKTGARPHMPSVGEVRFRYNPELRSLVSMVPAVIPMMLVFIPSMLMALGVVREKELGSIMNLYTTPVTKLEFLLGKQLPYIGLALIGFVLQFILALTLFKVPFTGSLLTLFAATILYVTATTGIGLLASTLTSSQVAALAGTAIATLIPAIQFSGMVDPVSSLQGFGAFMGEIYPTSHYLTISRGTFSKALGFADLRYSFYPLIIAIPVLTALSVLLLKKQEK